MAEAVVYDRNIYGPGAESFVILHTGRHFRSDRHLDVLADRLVDRNGSDLCFLQTGQMGTEVHRTVIDGRGVFYDRKNNYLYWA